MAIARAVPPDWLPSQGLIAAGLALCLLRVVIAAGAGLTDDEAYYRLWGLAPAISYLDHPPLAGWLIWLGQQLAGDTTLGVRLAAVLAPLLGTLLTWRTAGLLFGRAVAAWAAWFGLAMPLLSAGGVIMTPDIPSVLAWGLTSWAVAELWHSKQPYWWLLIGLFAGLGLLSKYTNLFAGAGIVLWLLVSGQLGRWTRSWQLWAGAALGAVCFAPVLIWNQAHHWASFTKQFGRVGAGHELTWRFLGELLGGAFGLLSPAIAVLAAIGGWQALKVARRDRQSPEALLLCGLAPVVLYLLVHALHDRVQPNWPAPIYPAFGVLAGLAASRLELAPAPGWRRFTAAALPLGFGISALIYLHVFRPLLHLPGDKDPTAQMQGWAAFGRAVDAKRAAAGAQWIATSSYAMTGQLAFREPQTVPVLQLTERLRYLQLPAPDPAILLTPALYVELQRRAEPDLLRQRFGVVEPLGLLTRDSGEVPVDTYVLYKLANPIAPVLDPID